MNEVKTEKQLVIELRDRIAAQIVGQDMSVLYWREVAKKSKKDTQDRVDAINQAAANQQLSAKDRVYLKIIDNRLKELK